MMRVLSLAMDDEEYDEDFMAPTVHALLAAGELLTAALTGERRDVPRFSTSTVGDGGVLIDWRRGARQLTLSVPPDESGVDCLYHTDGETDGVETSISAKGLAGWIAWLTQT